MNSKRFTTRRGFTGSSRRGVTGLSRRGFTGFSKSLLALSIASAISGGAQAQTNPSAGDLTAPPVMEEVQIVGRLQSGASDLMLERQEQAVATDYIGAEQIGRVGDSTVAIALTRVPSVTLVDDKFIFVRGLGERYSSTSLNGAMVPSPDLSRNVLPLDIFPTSIVESLAIQKVPSADKPAAFGGGSVDIRTTGIPDDFVFSVELGSGMNTGSSDFMTYNGGDDDRLGTDDGTRALSPAIVSALDRYRGNFALYNIRDIDNLSSTAQAEAVNRTLATALNRDISLRETSGEPDLNGEINLGNIFYLPNYMEVGFLAGASYDSSWRNRDITQRKFVNPEEQVVFEDESVYSVDMSGNLSFGINFNTENNIETTSLFLRSTDDEVSVRNYFNSNRLLSDGRGFRNTELRYEQRELTVHQIHGEHELGAQTLDSLGLDNIFNNAFGFLEGTTFDWYYSTSDASTDLPNEVNALSNTVTDPETGAVLSSSLSGSNSSAVIYRFSELQDEVDSQGWTLAYPIALNDFDIKLSGGTDYWEKSRRYRQLEFYLGSTTLSGNDPLLTGPLGDVLSDANLLDANNGFQLRNRNNGNSYIAANQVEAAFGQIDVTWNGTWRAVMGSRWEDYQQMNLAWNPISYDGNQFPGSDSEDFLDNAIYTDDDVYNSAALTWMPGEFWAEEFQLRLSYGETTVRPDLREISDSSYFDPITDIAVDGNPNVVPSQLKNYDLRGEWFFSNGDNLTVSLFYKDIVNPIELFEGAATDDNITAEIHNAASAEVSGLEVEFMKNLGDLTEALDPFFIQGNVALLDHELAAGESADAPTNPVRPLQGASDQVANLILGFDSYGGKHAATLAYNVFSERLFFAGRNGSPDSFEQPFHSLNFTYSFFPIDGLTVKFKAKNLLDQDLSIERTNRFADGSTQDVEIYNQKRGQDLSLSVQYDF